MQPNNLILKSNLKKSYVAADLENKEFKHVDRPNKIEEIEESVNNLIPAHHSNSQYFADIRKNIARSQIKRNFKIKTMTKRIVYQLSVLLNIVSILVYILESEFQVTYSTKSLEVLLNGYFVVELSLRYWLAADKLKFVKKKGTLFYFLIILYSGIRLLLGIDLNINFLRIIRIISLSQSKTDAILLRKAAESYKIKKEQQGDSFYKLTLRTFTLIALISFILACVVKEFDHVDSNTLQSENVTLFTSLYFLLMTASLTGYGDIYLTAPLSRFFIAAFLFWLIGFLAYKFCKLINLPKKAKTEEEIEFKNHTIIIGNLEISSILSLINELYTSFKVDDEIDETVIKTVILCKPTERELIEAIQESEFYSRFVFLKPTNKKMRKVW